MSFGLAHASYVLLVSFSTVADSGGLSGGRRWAVWSFGEKGMRIPYSVFAVGRYVAVLTLIAGSVLLMSAPKKPGYSRYDKARYADPNLVQFVRPGLNISIVSANIASDGTISIDY